MIEALPYHQQWSSLLHETVTTWLISRVTLSQQLRSLSQAKSLHRGCMFGRQQFWRLNAHSIRHIQSVARHANGNQGDEVVQLGMKEFRETIQLEQEFEGNNWSELWRTPGNRHHLIILLTVGFFGQWSENGLFPSFSNNSLTSTSR